MQHVTERQLVDGQLKDFSEMKFFEHFSDYFFILRVNAWLREEVISPLFRLNGIKKIVIQWFCITMP